MKQEYIQRYSPRKIKFMYTANECIMQGPQSIYGFVRCGWAPALDIETQNKIGYIAFHYLNLPKYTSLGDPDGYLNHLEIFFTFDKLQVPGVARSRCFKTAFSFTSIGTNQELPAEIFQSKLSSDEMEISIDSYVTANILSSGERYWTLHIR